MNTTSGTRIVRDYTMQLDFAAEDIFPLLCPVREYDWIPQWHCRMVYSGSGYAEKGCVFQTDFGDEYGLETWVVSHYARGERIAFVRTGEMRATRYTITLAERAKTTTLHWQQEVTGLSEAGNRLIGCEKADMAFLEMMKTLETLLTDYLTTTARPCQS